MFDMSISFSRDLIHTLSPKPQEQMEYLIWLWCVFSRSEKLTCKYLFRILSDPLASKPWWRHENISAIISDTLFDHRVFFLFVCFCLCRLPGTFSLENVKCQMSLQIWAAKHSASLQHYWILKGSEGVSNSNNNVKLILPFWDTMEGGRSVVEALD